MKTSQGIDGFYLFDSTKQSMDYCLRLADALIFKSYFDKQAFIKKTMKELLCVVKIKNKKRTNRELKEAEVFFVDCLSYLCEK